MNALPLPRPLTIATLALTCAAAVAFAAPDKCLACSCAALDREGRAQAFEEADGAIVGKLIRRVEVDDFTVRNVYRVAGALKGRARGIARGERLSVFTASDGAMCGASGRVGDKYGYLLYKQRRKWHTNLCVAWTPYSLRRAHADAHP